ncbi:hypothetical protein ABB02_00057 [Clostridiaceae bacterium JG1575]|nr:hypothetical protein ABB02_00057 [Clostridiaceae bacterium JG1575]
MHHLVGGHFCSVGQEDHRDARFDLGTAFPEFFHGDVFQSLIVGVGHREALNRRGVSRHRILFEGIGDVHPVHVPNGQIRKGMLQSGVLQLYALHRLAIGQKM